MLFNSLEYWIFLPLVFLAYWALDRRAQNLLLLAASYLFYAWWDVRFLSLIVISSAVDYAVGLRIGGTNTPRSRRNWLLLSLTTNLGILGFFKYFNFFADSLQDALGSVGLHIDPLLLDVALPVGISFYTFQTLSYTIDIYRGQLEPHRDPVSFFAFVAFFPQLVAGPIERAKNLLPQFEAKRRFDDAEARDGLRQILWGLTKKIVVADNLARVVNTVYETPGEASGARLVVATVFFAFQIYCDFSGYSDIAIGSARLLGFRLMRNFEYPYFSTNIAEFWRRWHISLSTWFRDYVYIPLGGNRVSAGRHIRNVFITFVVSGLWHGANWTFVAWGALHGSFFVIRFLFKKAIGASRSSAPLPGPLKAVVYGVVTFGAVTLAWVFFRADSIAEAGAALAQMATDTDLVAVATLWPRAKLLIVLLVAVEWLQRDKPHPLHVEALPRWTRWFGYYSLIAVILIIGSFDYEPFIYFQF